MINIIRNMLLKAEEEKDLDLASLVDDLMCKLAGTCNAPSNWRDIAENLYEEFKTDEWLVNAVYEFSVMYSNDSDDEED